MKTVLITGVSGGLGYALAQYYLNSGYYVYGLSRTKPKSLDNNTNFSFLSLDLAQPASISEAVASWLDSVSSLDLVVLNAGKLGIIQDLKDTSWEGLNEVMTVNVWANKMLCDTLFKSNRQVKQVVAISSGASITGYRGWGAYAISKAALNMFMKLYALERADTHFTALAPGLVDTNMQAYLTSLPTDDRFSSLERLKKARHTDQMLVPDKAAQILCPYMASLLDKPSGRFNDIRNPDCFI